MVGEGVDVSATLPVTESAYPELVPINTWPSEGAPSVKLRLEG
jgi:hypothetical protein